MRGTVVHLIVSSVCLLFLAETSSSQSYEDSPFGFHPASIFKAGYPDSGFVDALNIGVRWHRPSVYMFWFEAQPDLGDTTLDFSLYDDLYGQVPEGINILANIAPQGLIDEGYCLPGSYLPVDSAKYVRFVRAAVERYDGDGTDDMPGLVNPITYWQVSNEPPRGGSDFDRLQRMSYEAIKEACDSCLVLIGGATGFPDDYIPKFLGQYLPILQKLNGDAVDIFDFHWYGTATGDYRLCQAVLDTIRTKLLENHFGDIPVWSTEMGSYSGTPSEPSGYVYQTEAQQAGDYLKRFVFPLSIGVKKIFPAFGLMEGFRHDDGYFDHTGLIYDGGGSDDLGLGVKKLAYYTYKLMTEKLAGSDWEKIETLLDGADDVYAYKFPPMETGKPVYVAWWDWFADSNYVQGDSMIVALTLGDVDSVRITQAVPLAESGADLDEEDYPAFFPTRIGRVMDGVLQLVLGEDPVFVEELPGLTFVGEEGRLASPERFSLEQNFPNPFNATTSISFQLPEEAPANLSIYNVAGQLVKTLVKGRLGPGRYTVEWNAEDVSSGLYFYRLQAGEFAEVKRCLVLK